MLSNIIAERSLKREQRVTIGRENVRCRHRPRIATFVFDKARPLKAIGLYHERRVRCVDDLAPLCQSLFDEAGFLAEKRIITIGEIANAKMADIEDLFTKDDYVALYNTAFGKKIKAADLTGADPIVQQIARAEGVGRYDHNAPAEILLRERAEGVAALSAETLGAFEALFKRINGTLA